MPETIEVDYSNLSQSTLETMVSRRVLDGRFGYNSEGLTLKDRPLTTTAVNRLSTMLGIPSGFLEKCSPSLQGKILQEFHSRTEREIAYLYDKETDTPILSFLWADYLYIPTADVYRAVLEGTGDETMSVVKERVGVQRFYQFITSRTAFEVGELDTLHFGVAVSNSMDGSISTMITLSFFRPTCTNGAMITTGKWSLPRRFVKTADVAFQQIKEASQQIYQMAPLWQENIRQLAGIPLENPADNLLDIAKRLGLSPHLYPFILEAYAQEENPTMWGAVNALTRAANDVPEPTRASELWRAAGHVVESGGAPCKLCGALPTEQHHGHREHIEGEESED